MKAIKIITIAIFISYSVTGQTFNFTTKKVEGGEEVGYINGASVII